MESTFLNEYILQTASMKLVLFRLKHNIVLILKSSVLCAILTYFH